jgi:hypothetical protein
MKKPSKKSQADPCVNCPFFKKCLLTKTTPSFRAIYCKRLTRKYPELATRRVHAQIRRAKRHTPFISVLTKVSLGEPVIERYYSEALSDMPAAAWELSETHVIIALSKEADEHAGRVWLN